MTAESSRPNFFVILDLDPAAKWDEAAFVRTLKDKRSLWSKQRSGIKTHPTTVEAQRNLALTREIDRVMGNQVLRDAERKAALAEREAELRQRRARLTERVDLMLAKGFLYDVEYEDLQTGLSAADPALRQRIEETGRRPFEQARQDNERLGPAMERNLRANLAIVGEADLYAVLRQADSRVSRSSPRPDLVAAADKLYQKARNTADKNRPEVGARQMLAGLARQIFGSDELERRYNFSMLLAPLDAIVEKYEQALAPVRAVDSRQFELFLREAAGKGVPVAVARDFFVGHFRARDWSVDAPSASAEDWLKAQVPCPRCRELNDPKSKHCAKCGAPLEARCPDCGARIPVRASACPECGFKVGQRDYAEWLAEQAEACLAQTDVFNAVDFLERAKQEWPLGSDSDEPLAVRLRKAEEKLGPVREQQRQAIKQIDVLMEGRSHRAARRQLRGLAFSSPIVSEMLQRCEEAVLASDQRLREARRPGLPDERRAARYLEALEYCSDNSEALRELSLLPPAPPRRLRVEADTERHLVRLTWEPASDAGCSSVVVRVDAAEPPASAVGEHRHVVTGGMWVDPTPLVGRPMSYAVFTQRDRSGTVSRRAAVTTEPVLLAAEPQLFARPGNGEIELSWVPPKHAEGVEIQRQEVPGGSVVTVPPPEDGATRAIDRNVRNGMRYRYTARALFAYHAPGQPRAEVRSSGVAREAVPAAPPALPGPVQARGHPPPAYMNLYFHKVELGWPQAERGTVRVVRSVPGAVPLRAGDELAEDELPRRGLILEQHEPNDVWFTGDLRLCTYTAVLVLNGRCYVGESRPYAAGPEVGGLRAEYAGKSVRVTWNWPPGVDEALIAWDADAEPSDPVHASSAARVRRLDGEASGRYDIPAGAPPRLYVQVAAVIREGGTEYFTSGANTNAIRQALSLRYEVRRGRGGRKLDLLLRPSRPADLPDLVLYGRSDNRPASRDDSLLARIAARPVEREPMVVRLPVEKAVESRSCRLFVADEADAKVVDILPPE